MLVSIIAYQLQYQIALAGAGGLDYSNTVFGLELIYNI